MSFNYIFSDEFEEVLRKIGKKDRSLAFAVKRKIEQIICLDKSSIQHFKNLRGEIKEYKRVHVGSFVLMFKINENLIVFDRFIHHDDAY